MAEKKKELGGRQLSMPTKIIIVLFAVIMALSMMLPSLAAFFNTTGAQDAANEQESQEQTTDDAADSGTDGSEGEAQEGGDEQAAPDEGEAQEADAEAESDETAGGKVPDNETLKDYAESYSPRVAEYEERLEKDPDNLAAILNLGQIYMSWGYNAQYASTTDEEKAYSADIINKAIEYFDRYLALHDSKSVRVDKDLCLYYLDRVDEAIADLEQFSEEDPAYPLVWANLGMLYELQGRDEEANSAYRKAAETDPDNTYGAKEYANGRIIELNSTVSSPADAGDASVSNINSAPESGLTSTLAQDSGVGF